VKDLSQTVQLYGFSPEKQGHKMKEEGLEILDGGMVRDGREG